MMKNHVNSTKFLLAAAATLALVACGGGGGGGSTTPATSTAPVVTTPNPGNLLAVLPSATYVSGSAEAQMFTQLNEARGGGTGFGYVTQSAQLDQSSKAHALYLQTADIVPEIGPGGVQFVRADGTPMFSMYNDKFTKTDAATGFLGGHVEEKGRINFTGVLPQDRAIAAGYAGAVGEVIAEDTPTLQFTNPCVPQLLATVFHRGALLDPSAKNIGIGLYQANNFNSRACVITTGNGDNSAKVPDGWAGVYPPIDGVNVVRAMWNGEAPNPAPEFTGILGIAISYFSAPKTNLVVSTFTLTGPAGVVQTKLVGAAQFPTYITNNQAYLVPSAPLARNTKYTATLVGSVDGKAVTKTWSFTTIANDGRCDNGNFGCN